MDRFSLRVGVLALGLAVPTALVPTTSWAGPSAEEEAALEEARDLFERGKAKYDTLDYVGAIELWQLAYAKVPVSEAGVRNTMVYNIALAQEKQYEIDGDVGRLQHALKLLEVWMRDYKAMYKPNDERIEEVNKAKEKIAQLKAKIAAAGGGEVEQKDDEEEEPDEEDEEEDEDDEDPPPTPEEVARTEARRMIIAGYSVGGAGILFVAGGVAGIVLVPDPLVGRGGGGTLVALGGALIITGGVLLGIGYKKKKKVESGNYAIIPSPILGRGTAGAAVTVRF